jgi:hypothetical protein
MQPGVYITFDVECSMGGAWADPAVIPCVPPSRAIMGEYDGRAMGLPLICDILARHGLGASFFVEAFIEEQGYPGEGERVCHYLLERGQDVQLHIHPNHKHFDLHRRGLPCSRSDQIAELPPHEQRALLEEGRDRMEEWTGRRPAAFRAGNMGASEQTLDQLAAVGIRIDSSYTFPYVGGQCRFADRELYNGSKWYGDVLEVSLSGFQQMKLPGLRPAKPLDLVGISAGECRAAIESICDTGADAVMILHSFSLMKVRDKQYNGGRLNRIVTGRFERLCRWLGEQRGSLPTRTFDDLGDALAQGGYAARAVPPVTLKRPMRALVRKSMQLFNNVYWT